MSRDAQHTTSQSPTPRPPRNAPQPGGAPRRKGNTNKRLANGLVALSTAAVMAIYGVGYVRTAPAAADTFAAPLAVATQEVAIAAPTATATAPPATATNTATVPATSTTAATTARASAAAASTATSTATTAATSTATATKTATAASAATGYRDGTYTGTGTSRHGSIGVTVVVSGGKIVSAEITQCGTRYPCSKIATLPGQVVARQSASVDFVSGSTDSSTAYKSAVAAALAQAD